MRRIAIALTVWGLIFSPVAAQTINVSPNPTPGPVNTIPTGNGAGVNQNSGIKANTPGTTGSVFVGIGSGNTTTTDTYNYAFGNGALTSLTTLGPAGYGGSVGIGSLALNAQTSASGQVAIGYHAGALDVCGFESVYIGNLAGAVFPGAGGCPWPENGLAVLIGGNAGSAATQVYHTVAIGEDAGGFGASLNSCTLLGSHTWSSGSCNGDVAVGEGAGDNATASGGFNVLVGSTAGINLGGTAAHNVFVGPNAGAGNSTSTNTGVENSAVGVDALQNLAGATGLTMFGAYTGQLLTNQFADTYIGYQAGQNNTGFWNTLLGTQAGQSNSGDALIAIGAGSASDCRKCAHALIVGSDGNTRTADVYFGEGNVSSAPTGYTIHGTGNKTANGAGGTVTIAGGKGMGTGAGGPLIFATAAAGPANYPTTAASGNGTTATITAGGGFGFTPQVGDEVVIAGVTPTGYNGTYSITAATGTTVSFLSSTTGSQTVAGTVALENPLVTAASCASTGICNFVLSPTAPTPTAGDNSTKVATTAFVQTEVGPLYNLSGTAQNTPHQVIGTATLSGGTVTVTLSGSAIFTSSGSYVCNANDTGGSALAASTQNQSGSSFKIFGTLTDVTTYICTGN